MSIESIFGFGTAAIANGVSKVTGAIQQAAQSTGISFDYLLATARIESNLNPSAQAPTSSAKGLYQFVDQTWLGTMKQAGPALGYSQYANAITKGPDGRYDVSDPAMRDQIMKLRSDPTASAMLAGAFTRINASQVSAAIGRQPTEGELYMAHFMGSDGAGKLISAASSQPQANASALFPQAAAANPSIFYNRSGTARSVSEVYANLAGKFETARSMTGAPSPAGVTPDTAGITQALAAASDQVPALPDTKPLFQAMFTDRVRAGVSPQVAALWATPKSGAAPATNDPAQPLDLFTDGTRPDIGKLFGNS
jgi:muramidase (phage lysozyme)